MSDRAHYVGGGGGMRGVSVVVRVLCGECAVGNLSCEDFRIIQS